MKRAIVASASGRLVQRHFQHRLRAQQASSIGIFRAQLRHIIEAGDMLISFFHALELV